MIKLPMSDFMQKYYQEKGIMFTDSEKATILWNSVFPVPKAEILSALKEITDTTADKALKTQINERLDAERRFQENDGIYFFICTPSDEGPRKEWGSYYFAALEAAKAYGKKESLGIFDIEKKIFEDYCPDDDLVGPDIAEGCVWYTKDGEMLHCTTFPYMLGISRDLGDRGSSRFEDAYIPLQNPYETGDIVRIVGDSRPAIVQESREQWDSLVERNLKDPYVCYPTFEDNCLRVEFLGEDGEMFHEHPHILSLEKIDQWEDELEWELLQVVSRLIKGEGEMDDFLYYYHKNLNRKR
jgi:hypothetical protein